MTELEKLLAQQLTQLAQQHERQLTQLSGQHERLAQQHRQLIDAFDGLLEQVERLTSLVQQ